MERVAENSRQLIFVADYRVLVVVVCTRVFFSVRHPFEICQPTTPSSFSFSLIWYSHSRNVSAELKDEEEGSLLPPPPHQSRTFWSAGWRRSHDLGVRAVITQHTRSTSRQYIYKLISEIVALYNNKRLARLLDTQTRQLKTSSSAEQSNGKWMRIYGDIHGGPVVFIPSPFQSLGVWWPCISSCNFFFFTPNNNNNNTVTAPAAQRFSLIHNACIVMMMMNNDKHNTRTRRCGTTLSFSSCCDYTTSRRVCFGFGWWDHSTCGYYIYPGRPVSSIGIIDWRATLSLYM